MMISVLAFGILLTWLGWRFYYAWNAWRAGRLNPKNVLFIGLAGIGMISLGVRYFSQFLK